MVRVVNTNPGGSTVLPSGGPTENGGRPESGKAVDKPTSSFDRRRHHLVRKEREPSKIFVPLDPNEVPRNPNRGQCLHTDPFAMDRPQVVNKRSRVKVQTPRGPQVPERRHHKVAPGPQPLKKPGFISPTGIRHMSPKHVPKAKHETTIEREQPPKSFVGSRRFQAAYDKQEAVSPKAASRGSESMLMSLNSPSRVASNVFQGCGPVPALPAPTTERVQGIRCNAAKLRQVTMQGVWGPMPDGRAPKPSSLAPWMQDSTTPVTGRSITARPAHTSAAPYAIQAAPKS